MLVGAKCTDVFKALVIDLAVVFSGIKVSVFTADPEADVVTHHQGHRLQDKDNMVCECALQDISGTATQWF